MRDKMTTTKDESNRIRAQQTHLTEIPCRSERGEGECFRLLSAFNLLGLSRALSVPQMPIAVESGRYQQSGKITFLFLLG